MVRALRHRYEIVLFWSDEDGVFIGEAPELPGCMAHGRTQAKALENIQEAIRLWLDSAREERRRVPRPKRRPTSRA